MSHQAYRAELHDILLNGSPTKLKRFMRKHGLPLPSSDEVLRVTFHKAITLRRRCPSTLGGRASNG